MAATTVSITLSEEEREVVQEVFEERQRSLLLEIARTDHYEFKAMLRRKAEVLDSVLNRLLVQA